jgi:hypothetical protein
MATEKDHVVKHNAHRGNEDLEGVEWLISQVDKTLRGFQNDWQETREKKERDKLVLESGGEA